MRDRPGDIVIFPATNILAPVPLEANDLHTSCALSCVCFKLSHVLLAISKGGAKPINDTAPNQVDSMNGQMRKQ